MKKIKSVQPKVYTEIHGDKDGAEIILWQENFEVTEQGENLKEAKENLISYCNNIYQDLIKETEMYRQFLIAAKKIKV